MATKPKEKKQKRKVEVYWEPTLGLWKWKMGTTGGLFVNSDVWGFTTREECLRDMEALKKILDDFLKKESAK